MQQLHYKLLQLSTHPRCGTYHGVSQLGQLIFWCLQYLVHQLLVTLFYREYLPGKNLSALVGSTLYRTCEYYVWHVVFVMHFFTTLLLHTQDDGFLVLFVCAFAGCSKFISDIIMFVSSSIAMRDRSSESARFEILNAEYRC